MVCLTTWRARPARTGSPVAGTWSELLRPGIGGRRRTQLFAERHQRKQSASTRVADLRRNDYARPINFDHEFLLVFVVLVLVLVLFVLVLSHLETSTVSPNPCLCYSGRLWPGPVCCVSAPCDGRAGSRPTAELIFNLPRSLAESLTIACRNRSRVRLMIDRAPHGPKG